MKRYGILVLSALFTLSCNSQEKKYEDNTQIKGKEEKSQRPQRVAGRSIGNSMRTATLYVTTRSIHGRQIQILEIWAPWIRIVS